MLATAPPLGTVTFLFTDMEGSTRLWDEFPDPMNQAVARHDELLTEILEDHAGYVFAKAGDGWGIAFGSAADAVRTALEIQERFAVESWPPPIEQIRIRMGIHAGTANQRDGDYFGTVVNRAARVSAAANGGQIFLTDAVHALISDETDAQWRFHDLGAHRLRDLTRAEHLWQVDLVGAAAPIADLGPRVLTGNLPKPGATVVGREDDVDAVLAAMAESRVVTLVGVGGVGKTTLAIEAARAVAAGAAGGAWFVDLTNVEEPSEVAAWIATSLGLSKRQEMNDLESLIDALTNEERIVVIDNAEHLIDRVAQVVEIIGRRVTAVKLLITSREPLSIGAEIVYRVVPLDVGGGPTMSAAARLFIERAMAAAPDLTPEAFAEGVVETICARVDGLPLAIELAAAHAETMTPAEILDALESGRLSMMSDSRSISPRHRSLDDLVAWSYERLDADTKRVFERLSIFVGGATTEAAESVCGDAELEVRSVKKALRALVRKSLIATDRSTGHTRFTMLGTLRTYAEQKHLDQPGHADAEARHARWFAEFSQRAAQGLMSAAEAQWLRDVVGDGDNLERAARWAAANQDIESLGALGRCLPYLLESTPLPGVKGWMDLALASLPQDDPARIDYGYAAGFLTLFGGDMHGWQAVFDEATASVGVAPRTSVIRDSLELISAFFRGDVARVAAETGDVIQRAYDCGEPRIAGSLACDLGLTLLFAGETERAWEVAEQLHARAEADGIPSTLAWSLYLLGELTSGPDPDAAIDYLDESIENAVAVGGQFIAGLSLIVMAATAGRSGKADLAVDAMYRAVRLFHLAGNRPQFWTAIRNLVEILHRLGHDQPAHRLHLASEAAADEAPELFGPYGDLYRHVVSEIEMNLADGILLPARKARPLDYAATAAFALAQLEELQG